MLKGTMAAPLATATLMIAPPVGAAKPPPKIDFDGAIELGATNGYRVFGLFVSFEGQAQVSLFIHKRGQEAIYTARGLGTADSVAVDLGALGKVDLEARPTGKSETVHSCEGKAKSTTVPGTELVGTLEFHGEEGFTEFSATHLPLKIEPILNVVCGGGGATTTTGSAGIRGVQMTAKSPDSPSLLIQQNHPGARVFYEARMNEKEGPVRVSRTVVGHLGAGALRYAPSLGSASFSAAGPFTGSATYTGRTPPSNQGPGRGAWLGSLKVDFPGHAAVRLAGPSFDASIVHARRTETSR